MLKIKERVWVADNGHRVAVKFSFHQDNGTIHDKVNKFSRVDYECECGRSLFTMGRPKKSHLNNHDSWTTPEQVKQILKML